MKLSYDIRGPIGVIRLDGPRGNPIEDPVLGEPRELEAFLADERVLGAVVCGSGPHFCVGADLEELERRVTFDPQALGARLGLGRRFLDALWLGPVPVCAAVRGSCLGGGLEIALSCHFRVASTGGLFGLPESTLGLLPGQGGAPRLSARLGRKAAIELVLSGRLVGAEEALALGLVDELSAPADVEAAARRRLERLVAGRSKAQVAAVMSVLATLETRGRDAAFLAETEAFLALARLPRPSRPPGDGGEP